MQKSPADASNFDEDFTQEKPQLTPIADKTLLASIDPEAFLNFSYTNPQFPSKWNLSSLLNEEFAKKKKEKKTKQNKRNWINGMDKVLWKYALK